MPKKTTPKNKPGKVKKTKANSTNKTAAENQLVKNLTKLTKEIERLQQLEFIKLIKKPGRLIWYGFLKGVAVGFGSVVGASLVVGVFVFILSKISVVPVIGDAVNAVIEEIDSQQILEQQAN
jgi:hypothetical protein